MSKLRIINYSLMSNTLAYYAGKALAIAEYNGHVTRQDIDTINTNQSKDLLSKAISLSLRDNPSGEIKVLAGLIARSYYDPWDSDDFFLGYKEQSSQMFRRLFGLRMLEARKKCGLTQQQLSERSCVRRHTISDIEKGRWSASIDLIYRILKSIDYDLQILKRDSSMICQ